MFALTGLLLLGNTGLALGAVAGKRAPPVLSELPGDAKAQPALKLPQGYRCDGWFKVESGKGCWDVANESGKGDMLRDIIEWNSVQEACKNLEAGSYACVSIVQDPDERVVDRPNGPVQPGIPQGLPCTKYIRVRQGEGCYQVAERADIASQVTAWNSPTDPNCGGLLPDHYACVAVGPLQPRVAQDCTRFMAVEEGSSCYALSEKAQVNINRIFDWNPSVGPDCHNLRAHAAACVEAATAGSDEPVTAVPEGRKAYDGISKDCKLFVPVDRGDTCFSLAGKYKVALADVQELNTCDKMAAGYYACIPEVSEPETAEAKDETAKIRVTKAIKDETKATKDETKATQDESKVTQDETKAAQDETGSCHALDVDVRINGAPSDAPAGTPAPCHVRGVSVAVDHSLDVAVGSQSHSTHDSAQGTVRPGGSLTVDHSLDVAVGPQSPSTQGTVRPGSLTVDHSLEVAVGSTSQPPHPQREAVQPDANNSRVGGSARKVKC